MSVRTSAKTVAVAAAAVVVVATVGVQSSAAAVGRDHSSIAEFTFGVDDPPDDVRTFGPVAPAAAAAIDVSKVEYRYVNGTAIVPRLTVQAAHHSGVPRGKGLIVRLATIVVTDNGVFYLRAGRSGVAVYRASTGERLAAGPFDKVRIVRGPVKNAMTMTIGLRRFEATKVRAIRTALVLFLANDRMVAQDLTQKARGFRIYDPGPSADPDTRIGAQ